MLFDERAKKFLEHPDTDDEIKACFSDLKVLGKSDFKHLLKWRFKMIRMLQKERKDNKANNDAPKKTTTEDENDRMGRMLAEAKRKREERAKQDKLAKEAKAREGLQEVAPKPPRMDAQGKRD